VGCLVYLYLCWRTMRENYKEEDMIAFGWVSLLVYLIGSRIAFVYDQPKLWLEFWKMNQVNVLGGYILWLLLAWLITKDREWKFFAFGEDSLINLAWINLIYFGLTFQGKLIILLLIVLVVGWVLKSRYRSLWWYKSGKKGFLFLLTNMVFFVGLAFVFNNYFYLIMTLLSGVRLVMLGNERNSK